jgi:hypothetical protein
MRKIAISLPAMLVIAAASVPLITNAEESHRQGPAARAAPAARPAPAVRPAAPQVRSAPAQSAPQIRAPIVRQQAPAIQRAPATVHVPNAPARVVTPQNVERRAGPQTAQPNVTTTPIAPNEAAQSRRGPAINPAAGAANAMALSPIRGANRATIRGQNFSVWRGSHRVHRDGRWRTFVGLGALGATLVGLSTYYPYAYIDATADYCQGWTEDGCQLRWMAVPTIDGGSEFECVAYCPWQ